MQWKRVLEDFKAIVPSVGFWSLRLVREHARGLTVREGVLQPPTEDLDQGAHITLVDGRASAYAATSELSRAGLEAACHRALQWLEVNRRHALFDAGRMPRPRHSGRYGSAVDTPWEAWPLDDKIRMLVDINRALRIHDAIVDWLARLDHRHVQTHLYTSDGVVIEQDFHYLVPGYAAVANRGAQTQMRTGGGWGAATQGGLERLPAYGFPDDATRVAEEALALLDAPECPDTRADLLLMPSQMTLQIHESIGHPLELDRILGDERNFAGASFVSPDMFGNYRYGSSLLNVTHDPAVPGEVANYGFDDEGTRAERVYLIREGILERPLGSAASGVRAGLPGLANARACAWNRPPIDRMANLNIEPGNSTFDELVAKVEYGVLMDTNRSWSIDDHRNKFQFGCEVGRLIQDGELRGLVRNPNYRGISAEFWRNLAGVGGPDTREVWGTPYCGKGEPNQMIQVGHASPPCLFRDVEVFGGD
nr:TldD/PmbA family protein [Thioalkalivibrio thiocyanodenitrificans]